MRERKTMGIIDPLYHECQIVTWDKSIRIGDIKDYDNNFSWYREVVNLPGSEGYNCKATLGIIREDMV